MNDKRSKASIAPVLILGVGTLVLLAGCHSGHGDMTAGADNPCPGCRTETRVMPITGMRYTTHACPSCKRVSALDETTQAAVERAVGGQVGDTVHACDRCGTSSDCPICRREAS